MAACTPALGAQRGDLESCLAPRPLLPPAYDLPQSIFWGGAGTPIAPPSHPQEQNGVGGLEDGGGSARTGWLLATKSTGPGWGDGRCCLGVPTACSPDAQAGCPWAWVSHLPG